MLSHVRPIAHSVIVTARARVRPHPPRRRGIPAALALVGLAAATAVTGVLGSASTVAAYPAPSATATLSGDCLSIAQGSGSGCRVRFVLYGATGATVNGTQVTFTTSGVRGAAVIPPSSRTGTAGPGEADATFLPGGIECGRAATIVAHAKGTSARTQIMVNCPPDNTMARLQLLLDLFRTLLGNSNW
jgi:hypothetical protein